MFWLRHWHLQSGHQCGRIRYGDLQSAGLLARAGVNDLDGATWGTGDGCHNHRSAKREFRQCHSTFLRCIWAVADPHMRTLGGVGNAGCEFCCFNSNHHGTRGSSDVGPIKSPAARETSACHMASANVWNHCGGKLEETAAPVLGTVRLAHADVVSADGLRWQQ
jgi:hypothetical protein